MGGDVKGGREKRSALLEQYHLKAESTTEMEQRSCGISEEGE